MKKENKELAKAKKAKQRAKDNRKKKIAKILGIWVPAVLIVAVIALIVFAIVTSGETNKTANGDVASETQTESEEKEMILDRITGTVVNSGDKINLDYVGTVDGVEFDGGSTQGMGTDLVLGSGSYIDGFEDAIIGHKVGEEFDINVTFPEKYSAELAGKDAVFHITINGIYKEK